MLKTTALTASCTALIALAPTAHADGLTDLEGANPQITNPDRIYPGQQITIPGQDTPYIVNAGDTLNVILAKASILAGNVQPAAPALPSPDDTILPPPAPDTPDAAPPAPAATAPMHESVNWDAVAKCESGDNWAIHTANNYEGGLQFLNSTWNSVKPAGAPAHAYQASRDEQIEAAEALLRRSGIGQWPVCGRRG